MLPNIDEALRYLGVPHPPEPLRRQAEAVAAELGDTGRILVRESGTEPVVRVMVEAPSMETCEAYVDQVIEVMGKQGHFAG